MLFSGQVFEYYDIIRVFILSFLELVLSADNALMIALLIHHLSRSQQKKALFIGILSAFVLRILAISFASEMIRFIWVEILGAAYLLFLSIQYFAIKKRKEASLVKGLSLWKTIVLIEVLDLAFALDSIISGLAFIAPFNLPNGFNPKIWILYAGAIIGIAGIRFAAEFLTRLLHIFPRMLPSAYLLIGWIGLQLFLDGFLKMFSINLKALIWVSIAFWLGTFIILGLGFVKKKVKDDI
jgi:YkoY family integral membrane protein